MNLYDNDIIWSDTRRGCGTYACAVERTGVDRHALTVTLVGRFSHLLHRESVHFTEPDPDKWRQLCDQIISKPELRTIER